MQITANTGVDGRKESPSTMFLNKWKKSANLEIYLPFYPAVPLLGIVPKGFAFYYRDNCTSMFTVNSIQSSYEVRSPMLSVNYRIVGEMA